MQQFLRLEGAKGTFTHIFSKISSFDIGHFLKKRYTINITSMKRFGNNRKKKIKYGMLLRDKDNLLQVEDNFYIATASQVN